MEVGKKKVKHNYLLERYVEGVEIKGGWQTFARFETRDEAIEALKVRVRKDELTGSINKPPIRIIKVIAKTEYTLERRR